MDKPTFLERAWSSCATAVEFARKFAIQELPSNYVLLVFPNMSHDRNLRPGEIVFPDESLPEDTYLGPMAVSEFGDRFWRDGRVPEWIDVGVGGVRTDATLLELLVCGRFTSDDALLYHQKAGYAPFSVKGPCLPPNWDSSSPRKFDVNWLRAKRPLKAAT